MRFRHGEAVILIAVVLSVVALNDQRKYHQANGLAGKCADLIRFPAKLAEEATQQIGRPYADAQSSVERSSAVTRSSEGATGSLWFYRTID